MSRISRRTFGKTLLASLGLAFFHPTRLVHPQLLGLFRGKGMKRRPLPPTKIFTSPRLT